MRTRPLIATVALLAAGCGSSQDAKPDLTVSAASSLTQAFTRYAHRFKPANARLSFAGSDELAAQIQQGVKPDVFAAANTKLPDMLFAKRLVARPVVFTANRLVIAVPAGSNRVGSLADLARPGVTIAIGSAGVPIGSYTRQVLARLPGAEGKAILANVRSSEPDVKGVIAKVTEKAVDAGFVYVTDVAATNGDARAISLPASLQPGVAYAAAVVRGAEHAAQARAFVAGLLHGEGQRDLRRAGFLPVPR